MKKNLLITVVCFFLAGCATQYNIKDIHSQNKPIFKTQDKIILVAQNDGTYNNIKYDHTGLTVIGMFANSLISYFAYVSTYEKYLQLNEAIELAKKDDFDYLFYYTILHWEDRATEWSGIRDRASIRILIINPEDGNFLNTIIVSGAGTWWTLCGYKPQDIFRYAMADFIKNLLS